jgi:hypothetical protein
MATGMTQERRRAPRISERIALAVSGEAEGFRAEAVNVSTSGAYCTMDRFIPPMTKLQLQFELPHNPRRVQVRCEGVVVRVEPVVENAEQGRFHVAIFFSDIADRDRAAISAFVRDRLAQGPSTS